MYLEEEIKNLRAKGEPIMGGFVHVKKVKGDVP